MRQFLVIIGLLMSTIAYSQQGNLRGTIYLEGPDLGLELGYKLNQNVVHIGFSTYANSLLPDYPAKLDTRLYAGYDRNLLPEESRFELLGGAKLLYVNGEYRTDEKEEGGINLFTDEYIYKPTSGVGASLQLQGNYAVSDWFRVGLGGSLHTIPNQTYGAPSLRVTIGK